MARVFILIFLAVIEATQQSTCVGPASSQCEVSLLQTEVRLQYSVYNADPDASSEARAQKSVPLSRRDSVTAPLSVITLASTVHSRGGLATRYCLELFHRATSHSADAAVIVLVMAILIAVVLGVMMVVLTRHDDKESSAQDLLNKSLEASSAQDSRRPSLAGSVGSSWSKLRVLAKAGFVGRGDQRTDDDRIIQKPPMPFTSGTRSSGQTHLMPEMLVREPGGAQFVIDGFIDTKEQQGSHLEVWRISADLGDRMVMKFGFGEGTSHQKGITGELPDSTPVALINTNFAFSAPKGNQKGACSSNRHVTIFDTVSGLDLSTPFAKVERESNGTHSTVRRLSGEVIMIIQSGGYNTDFGNIVDHNQKLIATLSNRGHGMTGLGRLAEGGVRNDNRRVVQVAEGVDAMLVVCAIISATKLDPGSACTG